MHIYDIEYFLNSNFILQKIKKKMLLFLKNIILKLYTIKHLHQK